MSTLRLAIIGGGHLGRIHAKLAKGNEQFDLIAVAEPSEAACRTVQDQLQIATYRDYRQLVGQVDAAIVATPTSTHYEVASTLLRAGIHVLVEKPLAASPDQADRLVQIANHHRRILQVGHVERFNPSWTTIQPRLGQPKFIEAVRAGSYSGRSTDIGVVMDLMIHDIDLILNLVRSEVQQTSACGIAVLGEHEDLAEARLTFANGCVASLRASRIGLQATRRMQIYTTSGFAEIDFQHNEARLVRPSTEIMERVVNLDSLPAESRMQIKDRIMQDYFQVETIPAQPRNAILDEQNDFALSIRTGSAPSVTGVDGSRAVKVADLILQQIAQHRWNGAASKPWQIGPLATQEPTILSLPAREPTAQTRRKAG